MLTASPYSLLLVTLVRANKDKNPVLVVGPFRQLNSYDRNVLSGCQYPNEEDAGHTTIARYSEEQRAWIDSGGEPLFAWTVTTVDAALNLSECAPEKQKAKWVLSEFPPEGSQNVAGNVKAD